MFGAGTIGIAAAIALRYFGCKQVMVCDHSDFRMKKAKDLGFAVCNNGKEDLRQAAIGEFGKAFSALGKTADVDIYIDAVGTDGTPAVPAAPAVQQGEGNFCENCGAKLSPGAAFCEECGAPVADSGTCKNCGYRFERPGKFCPQCGKKREE